MCGSNLHLASGHMGPVQSVLGHERVGRVVATGSAVSADFIALGTRVGVAWVRDICGECSACLRGEEGRCSQLLTSGRVWDVSFAEYAVVAPMLCGGVTAYKALKVCGATPGSWVAVSGVGGGVGALAIQFATAMGYRVLAAHVGKGPYCNKLGAEAHLVAGDATAEAVGKIADGGVQAVIVAAGSNKAYQLAIGWLAAFRTLVCVGVPPADQILVGSLAREYESSVLQSEQGKTFLKHWSSSAGR